MTKLSLACGLILLMSLTACSAAPTPTLIPASTPMPSSTVTPAASSTPESGVQVWLTLPDQSKRLHREPNLPWESGAGASAKNVTVDDQIKYQQIEGVGAAMTDSAAWLIMNKLTAAQRDQVLRDLFTRDGDGIGLNYLRLPMGASDFALQDYTYDDVPGGGADPELKYFSIDHDREYIIPALQLAKALNPQLRFMGSPWSAPAWMKRGDNVHGGALNPDYFQAFADYHVKFAQAYAAEGLPIDTLTPQNEPLFQTNSYPTMGLSAQDQQTFIRDYLGPAVQAAGLNTRLVIYDHNWDQPNYPLEVLSDPGAAQYVSGVAFHCYGGDVSAQSTVHAAFPDKGIWFTECSGGDWAKDWSGNFDWNTRHLVIGNFRNWGQSFLMWNLALDENAGPQNGGCNNCRGVITINQTTGAVTYNEEYYFLGQVSKFIDPGAYRIESPNGDHQPDNVAFQNPDGSVVIIVHAQVDTDVEVTWRGRHFTYHLPAYATATFKWTAP